MCSVVTLIPTNRQDDQKYVRKFQVVISWHYLVTSLWNTYILWLPWVGITRSAACLGLGDTFGDLRLTHLKTCECVLEKAGCCSHNKCVPDYFALRTSGRSVLTECWQIVCPSLNQEAWMSRDALLMTGKVGVWVLTQQYLHTCPNQKYFNTDQHICVTYDWTGKHLKWKRAVTHRCLW